MPLPTGDLGSRGNQDVINRHSQDFQELEQAAVERLSGLDSLRRRRTTYLPAAGKDQDVEKGLREIDLYKAGRETRKELVARALNTQDQDQEQMLRKVRERMERVGIELASVEVRYENLNVESSVYVGNRALPTVLNSYRNVFEKYLQMLRLVKSNKRKFTMLDNVSGILPPGRMTLLLGPPGAGKSTLLQVLSGKLIGSDLKIDGNITYNGKHFNEFVPRRTAAYVDQTDIHLGELTVRETFDFSSRCQGVGHKAEELEELLKREKEQGIKDVDPWLDAFMKAEVRKGKRETVVSDYIIKILGLDVCADTIVGNAMIRGISGGQKKRVTTGEMIVGPCKTLFLDEISTGLDSSSTFQIVKCMRDFVHHRQATLLMALLQPAPECYDLFDDILLLSEGLVVYHGPRDEVLPFFESCGFKIPGRKAIPDFLQEVTSKKDQEQYWFNTKNPYKFVPVMAFADAFKRYKTGQRNAEALSVPYPAESGHKQALVYNKFALSSWQSFKALLRREYMLVERNSFVYIFKATQAGIVAFIVGTVFLRTQLHPNSQDQAQSYAAMLFFSLLQMFFNGIAEMTFTIDRLPVFYKQRDALFFPTWSYVVPTNIGRLPVSFLETTIWVGSSTSYMFSKALTPALICAAALTYWEVGLAPNAGRFFMYYLIIFLIHNMAISLFRAIGSLARNIVVANALGSMALFCVILMGGFVLVKDNIHPWTVWVFWINPMQYAQRAILINEFSDPRWQNLLVPGSTQSVGNNQLATYGFVSHYWWVWLGVGVLIFANLLFLTITILAHQFLDSFEGSNTTVSEDMLNERAFAAKGHTNPNAGPEEVIDIKDQERTSQRISQRRMALQDYASKHMSSRAIGAGSRKSIDPASRRSMNFSQGSLELQRPGGSKKLEGGEAEGLQSYSEEGTNGTVPNGTAAPGYPQTDGPTSGRSSNFGEGRSGNAADGADSGEAQRGMVLPFEPLTMSFDNMHYFVDVPAALAGKSLPTIKKVDGKDQLELLQGITSAFRPGILTCLMGVSGAGKTTLMDVLAGRKTGGIIQGDIRINGYPKKQETFARVSGYVEQFDVHSPQTTIREALLFSGRLRFSKGVERSTIDAFVDEVMDLVELGSLRDSVVGVPGVSGLSVEQRKRLTIAVELVANPSIVFMDEPTSGLDARAAAIVMRTVRNIVNTGRTIVCTIHQPSIDIFESFDELLLLKRGGETIYAGPLGHDSADLIDYYEAVQGVPRIREGLNPATWMLEITTPGQEDRLQVDFAEVYRNSQLAKDREALVKAEAAPHEGIEDLKFDSVYARGFMEQFRIMLWKFNIVYWRLPEYNGVRFSFTLGIGLIFGAVFWRLGGKSETEQDLYNILGALYTAVLFLGIMNSIFVQPIFSNERAVFYRERAAGMYSVAPWYLGIAVIEISYLLVQTIMYTAITYPMAWFYMSPAKWFWYLWFMFLTLMYFNFYGIACVAVTPNLLVAAVLSGAFYGIFNLFAGFVISRGNLPGWWVWMYFLNPVAWTLYGLVGSNLGDIHTKFVTLRNGGGVQSVPDFLLERFEYSYGFLGQVSAILIAWCIILWALGAFAMKKLNFQKR